MKRAKHETYNANIEKIKASGLKYYEVSIGTCVFDIVYEGSRTAAVYYASVGRLMVAKAGVNELVDAETALSWIKKHL